MFSTRQQFSGLVVAQDLHEYIMLNPILKNEYCTRDLIIDWCKERSITWPNGNSTKQIVLPHGSYSRAYLIKDYERDGQKLSNMTEGLLGMHYYFSTFDKEYGTLRSKLEYHEREELKKHKTNYVEPRPKDIL